jgi:hypothetical protein
MLPVGATAAMLWLGAGSWIDRYFLGTRPLRYLGLVSYPLYLWHWPILSFMRIEAPGPSVLMRVAGLIGSLVLAMVTYNLLERPLKTLRLRVVSVGAFAVVAVLLGLGATAHIFGLSGMDLSPTQVALTHVYNPQPDYRYRQCFLDPVTQTGTDFGPECTPVSAPDSMILLWGDSLAAQLYPGLRAHEADGYTTLQLTAGSCPPSMHDTYPDRGHCNAINGTDRALIARLRPATVVIDGRWPAGAAARDAQISELATFLGENGARRIVLVGPAPDWVPSIRGLLVHTRFPGDKLPEFMRPPEVTWGITSATDESLRKLAARLGIGYLSIVEQFCANGQCRIRVSDDIPEGLVTSDHDHLTAQASIYLVGKLNREQFWSGDD